VIDKTRARALAVAHLATRSPEADLVILDEHTEDHGWCWAFYYQTRTYAETRNPRDGILDNGPLLVHKQTGQIQEVPALLAINDMKNAVRSLRPRT
jgi:hypothetical protein